MYRSESAVNGDKYSFGFDTTPYNFPTLNGWTKTTETEHYQWNPFPGYYRKYFEPSDKVLWMNQVENIIESLVDELKNQDYFTIVHEIGHDGRSLLPFSIWKETKIQLGTC